RSCPEFLVVCIASARARRVWSELRIFGPRLHYEIGFKRLDDVASGLAGFVRRKSGDVVTVPVRCDHGMKFAPCPLLDVFGDIHHARLRHAFGKTGRTKIDQHVPLRFSTVLKAQEKAVAESDVVRADRRAGGYRRHRSLLIPSGAYGAVRRIVTAARRAASVEAAHRRNPIPPNNRAAPAGVWR